MKLSKMRTKARSRFQRGEGNDRIKYRTADGVIHDVPPLDQLVVKVTLVRGRAFTKPQCARQRGS